jgi:hypothetical protein
MKLNREMMVELSRLPNVRWTTCGEFVGFRFDGGQAVLMKAKEDDE